MSARQVLVDLMLAHFLKQRLWVFIVAVALPLSDLKALQNQS